MISSAGSPRGGQWLQPRLWGTTDRGLNPGSSTQRLRSPRPTLLLGPGVLRCKWEDRQHLLAGHWRARESLQVSRGLAWPLPRARQGAELLPAGPSTRPAAGLSSRLTEWPPPLPRVLLLSLRSRTRLISIPLLGTHGLAGGSHGPGSSSPLRAGVWPVSLHQETPESGTPLGNLGCTANTSGKCSGDGDIASLRRGAGRLWGGQDSGAGLSAAQPPPLSQGCRDLKPVSIQCRQLPV